MKEKKYERVHKKKEMNFYRKTLEKFPEKSVKSNTYFWKSLCRNSCSSPWKYMKACIHEHTYVAILEGISWEIPERITKGSSEGNFWRRPKDYSWWISYKNLWGNPWRYFQKLHWQECILRGNLEKCLEKLIILGILEKVWWILKESQEQDQFVCYYCL